MRRKALFLVLALSCGNDELVALKAERDSLKAQLSAVTVHAETWLAFVSVVEAITNTDVVSFRTYSRKLYDMKLDDRVYGVLNNFRHNLRETQWVERVAKMGSACLQSAKPTTL